MKIILVLFLSIIVNYAQAQCLVNNFEQTCGTTISPCPYTPPDPPVLTFSNTCVPNVTRSQGTPQIKPLIHLKQSQSVFMWADNTNNSEGIVITYSFFANHTYTISLSINTDATGGSGGTLNLFGVNGVPQIANTVCGATSVPTFTNRQAVLNNGAALTPALNIWTNYVLSFTPTMNYSQLWIYPSTTSPFQLDTYLDYVNICVDCNGIITYNNGQMPTNSTKAGTINVGSTAGTGGAGTVTVSSTANTSLQATNSVNIVREFRSTVTTGTLSIVNIPCDDILLQRSVNAVTDPAPQKYKAPTGPPKRFEDSSQLQTIRKDNRTETLNVSPNPSLGMLKISGNSKLRNATLIVSDQTGKTLLRIKNRSKAASPELDLRQLQSGTYFIQILMGDDLITKKILITK